MNTTALRIELLIVGFQGVALTAYIFFSDILAYLSGIPQETLLEYVAPATVVLLALGYTVGSIIDGVTAAIQSICFDFFFWDPVMFGPAKQDDAMLRVHHPEARSEIMSSDYDQRLLRSTGFNLLLGGQIALIEGHSDAFWILTALGFVTTGAWLRRYVRIRMRYGALITYARSGRARR